MVNNSINLFTTKTNNIYEQFNKIDIIVDTTIFSSEYGMQCGILDSNIAREIISNNIHDSINIINIEDNVYRIVDDRSLMIHNLLRLLNFIGLGSLVFINIYLYIVLFLTY